MTPEQRRALAAIRSSTEFAVTRVYESKSPPARVFVWTDDDNEAQIHADGVTLWAWSDAGDAA